MPLLPDSILPVISHDPHHPLPNRDLDTGRVVQPGGYPLTDSTFASLLHKLTRQPKVPVPMGIKEAIESYYSDPELPITTKKDPQLWAKVQADLATLKACPPVPGRSRSPLMRKANRSSSPVPLLHRFTHPARAAIIRPANPSSRRPT